MALRNIGNIEKWFKTPIRPIIKILVKLKISPNIMSVIGVFISLIITYVVSKGYWWTAFGLGWVSAFFDISDGMIARELNMVRDEGAFLDSSLDRLSDTAIFFGYLLFFINRMDHSFALKISAKYYVIFTVLCLSSSLIVSYIRARAENFIEKVNIGLIQRPERYAILGIGIIAGVPELSIVFLLLGNIITIIQRFVYSYINIKKINDEN